MARRTRGHVAQGEVLPLFEDWRLDPMPLYVAFAPNRHVSAKLRVFIDWVASLMAVHAPVTQRPAPTVGGAPGG